MAQSGLVDQGEYVRAFGPSGTAKTHARCGLGHPPAEAGYSVLFTPACRLVRNCRRPGGSRSRRNTTSPDADNIVFSEYRPKVDV